MVDLHSLGLILPFGKIGSAAPELSWLIANLPGSSIPEMPSIVIQSFTGCIVFSVCFRTVDLCTGF
jgi:hypothetical protein